VRMAVHHLFASTPTGSGTVRERVIAVAAGSGAGAKALAAALTVAVIAGGSIGATHLLGHSHASRAHHRTLLRTVPPPPVAPAAEPARPARGRVSTVAHAPAGRSSPRSARRAPLAPGHVVSSAPRAAPPPALGHYEPGGFAYLGVPTTSPPHAADPSAAAASAHEEGGPFSP
jgi:hypothetical protein